MLSSLLAGSTDQEPGRSCGGPCRETATERRCRCRRSRRRETPRSRSVTWANDSFSQLSSRQSQTISARGDHLRGSAQITLFVDGEPKPINQLSKGQMATALLPLSCERRPIHWYSTNSEDDLDNAFVFSTLIGKIKDSKLARQLIFRYAQRQHPSTG